MATGTIAKEAEFLSPLAAGALLFRRMNLHEALGRMPSCVVELVRPSADAKIAAADLLGQKATVKLLLAEGEYRYFNGWVTRFERGGVVGRYDLYRVELRPWLWYLGLGKDSRIFQDKNALQILEAVFGEYGQQQMDNKLSGTPHTRPYCVQYRETDLDFVHRLMEEEGMYYYFSHVDGDHKLVLCNGAAGHSAMPGASMAWAPLQTDDRYREDVITEWRQADSLGSLKHVRLDHDYLSPTTDTTAEASRTLPVSLQGDGEVFDYPGAYADPAAPNVAVGTAQAQLATDIDESGRVVGTGMTRHRPVAVGSTFTFKDYPAVGTETEWLVSLADYDMAFGSYEADGRNDSEGFVCRFEAVPKSIRFQPERITPRPVVQGPQTAVVVGPSGDEIHTEAHGRIKVQFRWDRVGANNETSSCWIRVAMPWASKGYGMMALPRMGDEVVVSFLEGDPDRPLVTGSVYNADNKPPWALPAQATVSGIKTRSSKQGTADTANELRFDDKKDSEYVWLQAQKDFHLLVKHDAKEAIQNDRWTDVTKNEAHQVGENLTLKVGKQATLSVTEDTHATLGADLNLAITGLLNVDVTDAVAFKGAAAVALTAGDGMDLAVTQALNIGASTTLHLKGDSGVVIDGGSELCIKAGGAFILLNSQGVTIQGSVVKINCGGAAGTANDAAEASPAEPTEPTVPAADQDPLSS